MATNTVDISPVLHKPEDSLGFRLGTLSNLMALPFHSTYGKAEDLTLPEWRMLQVLHFYPEISIGEICLHTGMHKMQASRALQRSIRMKRVVWQADPNDGRRKLVILTADGKALCQRLYPSAIERESELQNCLDAEQKRLLGALLNQLIEQFKGERPVADPLGDQSDTGVRQSRAGQEKHRKVNRP